MIIPVVLFILGAIGAFAYAVALFVHSANEVISHPFPVGNKISLFLLDIDLMLIGATLLISAVGFYELFISDIPRHALRPGEPGFAGIPAGLPVPAAAAGGLPVQCWILGTGRTIRVGGHGRWSHSLALA